jgi:DNA-binding transcriptional LysR family regulator
LRAFEAADRLGSFVRASEERYITASAVSHQVRGLEAYFGRKLFEADVRAKVLTEGGARLSAALVPAFDAIESACAEVTPRVSASTLTVHCGPSFAAKWLGPRLSGFMARHPAISIRLSSGAGSYDLLRNEPTDVAIVYGDVPIGPGMAVDDLGEEDVTALCAPSLENALNRGA